ncbi:MULTISPECIES: neutral zinc metallopeptidase [unclassified Schlesneria]|uniref:KPN_02809 family neutral zinc metallopeptidase n=1 Tax=Schlesneria TaxID=656899 RepID=UPI002F143776
MRWEGGRKSGNLEDRRAMRPATMAAGGLGVMIVMLIAAFMGIDPRKVQQLMNNVNPPGGQGGQVAERELTPEERRSGDFAATILAFTEEVWDEQFRKAGEQYVPPRMVLFADAVATGCGNAPSAVGPFYCPADRTVYLDPTFFTELKEKMGGSDAEFSQAYVIAHEIGHHVQNLLGYSDLVNQKRQGPKAEFNRWSVRLELQADYLAGVWAHYGQKKFDFVEPGDVAAAIQSAQSIGDDRIQKNSRGFTSPESYTHGTSAQRTKWFKLGLQTGDLNRLKELFEIPYEDL